MDIQTFIVNFVTFANTVVIPFILGIAFLSFVVNVLRYFILSGSNKDSHETARAVATYSILAFMFILIFWGIVNMFVDSTGLRSDRAPISDYVQEQTAPYLLPGDDCDGTGPC